jgi:hypothetical protein
MRRVMWAPIQRDATVFELSDAQRKRFFRPSEIPGFIAYPGEERHVDAQPKETQMERIEPQHEGRVGLPQEGTKHLVTISVDGSDRWVPKGKYVVSEFKGMVAVSPEYELDQVEDGRFEPLPDGDTVHIKGGEVFVSHVRRGGSS